MVVIAKMDNSACRFLSNPMFASVGDVKQASEKYRSNRYDPTANDILQSYREFRVCCIETSLGMLEQFNLPEHVLISARLKRMESIYRKLHDIRELDSVGRMYDLIGFRLIFQSLDDLQSAFNVLKNRENIRINDYLTKEHFDKHGYRAVHAIFRFEQPFNEEKSFAVRFEVQLRTYYQHHWACWCEGMGEQAKKGYRNRRDEPKIRKRLNEFKSISNRIKIWEENNPSTVQGMRGHFPVSKDIMRRFAVVQRVGEIDSCYNSAEAFEHLMRYERLDLDALLLLGLSSDDIRRHFQETHINFLLGKGYEPEVWMPPDM